MDAVIDATMAEHAALADTLAAVGPDAPTLVEGWTTADLAAHLAALETGAGLILFVGRQAITRVHPRPTNGSRKMAAKALERTKAKGYDRAVALVRSPHRLPMRWGGAPVALFEVYVHHQDVLRADPASAPRPAPDALDASLPWLLAFHAKRLPGIELVVETSSGQRRAGTGAPVTVRGDVGEVVLWLAGRSPHCTVEIEGDENLVARIHPVTRI